MTRREWLSAMQTLAVWLAGAPLAAQAPRARDAGDPTTLSIAALGEAFGRGRLTPLDVTAAYLAAIDRRNPALGAYVTVARDRAIDDTRRVMTRPAGATSRGPLFGVPVAHKDLLATRAVRTTGGSKLHEAWIPEEDADLVARLARAGAVTLGKTNTHELGGGVTTINPFYGTTRNPRDPSRIPGGSSGGSAAAVAANLALVATGSDTGGSIRIPAALCGCVGFKPTFGLLPTTGVLGACPTFDHVGWLTRTVEDAAAVLAAIVPADTLAPSASALRVGVPRRYFFEDLEAGVLEAVESALARLRTAGASVRDVDLRVDAGLYDRMFAPIVVTEIRARYTKEWQARPDAFSKEFAAVFEGPRPSDPLLAAALAAREAFERSVAVVLDGVDVLALPTVPVVAPPIAGAIDGLRILRNTWAFNAARVPAVSVPCGTGEGGLPVGLQLVGRMHGDAALLRAATLVG